jgi:hypothetical protein
MPATLRTAIALLSIQVLAGAGLAVYVLYLDLTAEASSGALAAFVTVFCVLYVGGLAFTVASLGKGRQAARGVALALELLLLAPAYYMITGGQQVLGWVLLAVVAATVLTLMAPQTSRVLS